MIYYSTEFQENKREEKPGLVCLLFTGDPTIIPPVTATMLSLENLMVNSHPLICAPMRDALSSRSRTLPADGSNTGGALTFL